MIIFNAVQVGDLLEVLVTDAGLSVKVMLSTRNGHVNIETPKFQYAYTLYEAPIFVGVLNAAVDLGNRFRTRSIILPFKAFGEGVTEDELKVGYCNNPVETVADMFEPRPSTSFTRVGNVIQRVPSRGRVWLISNQGSKFHVSSRNNPVHAACGVSEGMTTPSGGSRAPIAQDQVCHRCAAHTVIEEPAPLGPRCPKGGEHIWEVEEGSNGLIDVCAKCGEGRA